MGLRPRAEPRGDPDDYGDPELCGPSRWGADLSASKKGVLAEDLVRLDDPSLTGCPSICSFTHRRPTRVSRGGCHSGGRRQREGGSKLKLSLWRHRATRPHSGTEVGVHWQQHWKERFLEWQVLGAGKFLQALGLGRGPTRTQCESKVWDSSLMGGGAGRRAGDAQGSAQDRAEPASSPGPSPQRWRNWGLGRTHELPKDPQQGCHKKLGILDIFYNSVPPGSLWKELQVRLLGEGYSSSFPAGRDQANLGLWGCARCRDMCKDSTARTWRRRRSGAWGTAGAKKPQSFTLKEAVNREARRAAEPVGCREVPGEQHCLF